MLLKSVHLVYKKDIPLKLQTYIWLSLLFKETLYAISCTEQKYQLTFSKIFKKYHQEG